MKASIYLLVLITFLSCGAGHQTAIDRNDLVNRNNPKLTAVDTLGSLSVGNGEFAYTVDITGMQTFPVEYSKGMPLGTQSQWGWHSFTNVNGYKHEETLREYDFGRGKTELYAVQYNEKGRQQEAANYFRVNPHRLHLGSVGLELNDASLSDIKNPDQTLDMWNGKISSKFEVNNTTYQVETSAHPNKDMIAVRVQTKGVKPAIKFRFPYPTGNHTDDASDWNAIDKHSSTIIQQTENSALIKRQLDTTVYYVNVEWENKAKLTEKYKNYFVLQSDENEINFTSRFSAELPDTKNISTIQTLTDAGKFWNDFWTKGAAVDFSECTDERAKELERRVVLSQYLLAIQCSGSTPPQETGLTYNSWYGKFHLEMIWWHQVQFALWNRPEMLERTLGWYNIAEPNAKKIAQRQKFDGVRWMKMTDPSAMEAPSKVGSFLIWQQPHFIYMAELIYRSNPTQETLDKYAHLVEETAKFMYSFATYDELEGRFILKGTIPAQETLRASETINPPFELSYWHYALSVAQEWRERSGQKRNLQWDEMIDKLSPLTYNSDGLYLASEDAVDTYKDIRFTSDHPAVLGAVGILPINKLIRKDYMHNTLNWIWDNWNWGKTWGWDYPMTAMSAARLGEPEKAVGALLMEKRTNTYLVNGHNYQDGRLRVYLPGNGGLLTAVAMMCAGWDGSEGKNPGFPKDGKWKVKWEGLQKMP